MDTLQNPERHTLSETEQIKIIRGEKATIRKIDPKNPDDIQRLHDIDHWPEGTKWIFGPGEKPSEKKELRNWVRDLNDNRWAVVYAVSGSEGVDPTQSGRLQGWVRLDYSAEERRRIAKGLNLDLQPGPQPPIEFSYIKHPEAPERLMASGVRQICMQIFFRDEIAFTSNKENDGKEFKPTRIVTAFIKRENTDSQRLLENAGFVKKAENVPWDEKLEPGLLCDLYVLDWNKLQEIEHKKEDKYLSDKYTPLQTP